MSRGAQKEAQQTFQEAQGAGKTAQQQAQQLYGPLTGMYSAEAVNPQGFGAPTEALMKSQAMEAASGGAAGIEGKMAEQAARTRNLAGATAGMDEAARQGLAAGTEAGTNIDIQNAKLKEAQRQSGISGLSGLYGQQMQDLLASMGVQNQAVNAQSNAGQSGWLQNVTGVLGSLSGAGGKGWSL